MKKFMSVIVEVDGCKDFKSDKVTRLVIDSADGLERWVYTGDMIWHVRKRSKTKNG